MTSATYTKENATMPQIQATILATTANWVSDAFGLQAL